MDMNIDMDMDSPTTSTSESSDSLESVSITDQTNNANANAETSVVAATDTSEYETLCYICGQDGDDDAFCCGNDDCKMIVHEACLPQVYTTPDQYNNSADQEDPDWQCPCCSLREDIIKRGKSTFVSIPFATVDSGSNRNGESANTVKYDIMKVTDPVNDGGVWYASCKVYKANAGQNKKEDRHVLIMGGEIRRIAIHLMDGPLPDVVHGATQKVDMNYHNSRNYVDLNKDCVSTITHARGKRMDGLLDNERLEDAAEAKKQSSITKAAVRSFVT